MHPPRGATRAPGLSLARRRDRPGWRRRSRTADARACTHRCRHGLVGFICYGLSLALFVFALRDLGTARTSAYFSTAPFIGAATAFIALQQPLTIQLLAAGTLMAVGVWLHVTERHAHPHTHHRMAHAHSHSHDEHHRHSHGPQDPPGEPHTHAHEHDPLTHSHPHVPDMHHDHRH